MDPSCVKIVDVPNMGKGLIAVKDFKKGDRVLFETALLYQSDINEIDSQTVMKGSRLSALFLELDPEKKKAFMDLYDPDPSGPDWQKPARIYVLNRFTSGLYPSIARMNHSCNPNVFVSSRDKFGAEAVAARDISAGEQIFVSYLGRIALSSRAKRREALSKWMFVCKCEVCSLDDEKSKENDQKRAEVKKSVDLFEEFRKNYKPELAKECYLALKRAIELLETELVELEALRIQLLQNLSGVVEIANTKAYNIVLQGAKSSTEYLDKARELCKYLGKLGAEDAEASISRKAVLNRKLKDMDSGKSEAK